MNQAINFFWTILCFIPVIAFWRGADIFWLYIFIGISVVSLLLPAKLLQLSRNPKFYESLGVKFIRKLVQSGDYANRLIRRKNPQYKLIKNKANVAQYMRTIIMYERYHFLCFIFFLLTTIYALIHLRYVFVMLIIISNIIYNVCPILLQQYNRARVLKLSK
jgi:hypothetical protein